MQKFDHRRALALLGALTLYIFLWPIYCCAAKPTWSPLATDMQISRASENHDIKSNFSISNQTYHGLITASEFSDNMGTNDKVVDSNDTNSNSTASDKGAMIHKEVKNVYKVFDNRAESSDGAESMTTSIYELFDLDRDRNKSKVKTKTASSNQILSRTDRSVHLNSSNSKNSSVSGAKRVKNNKTKLSTLERNERSANLSHITGSARKIQLYIKNRFLQLLPDGTVNGTTEDMSDYSEYFFPLRVFRNSIVRSFVAFIIFYNIVYMWSGT